MRFLLFACLALTACSGNEPETDAWVGTWSTSMAELGRIFENETVRQVANISVGGDKFRVTLSQVFGSETARISMASIGIQDSGARIVAGTLRPLTFGGDRAVELEPGMEVDSDPVDLEVSARSSVVVSVYVEAAAGPATTHPDSYQTAYVAEGNFVDTVDMPEEQTETSWYWLAGIDVEKQTRPLVVVTLGDSITEGTGSSIDANARYPDVLARELADDEPAVAVLNAGIGGNRVLTDVAPDAGLGFGPSALSRFDRDVLSQPGVTHVLLLEGVNDLGIGNLLGPIVTGDELIAGYERMIEQAHDQGLSIMIGTILPFRGATFGDYWTPENEQKREVINEWIRTTSEHDGFVDFDEALRDPADPEQLLPAFDIGDHLHPNDAGYRRMGAVAVAALR